MGLLQAMEAHRAADGGQGSGLLDVDLPACGHLEDPGGLIEQGSSLPDLDWKASSMLASLRAARLRTRAMSIT